METNLLTAAATEPTVRLQLRDDLLTGIWLSFRKPDGVELAVLEPYADFDHLAQTPSGWYWYRHAEEVGCIRPPDVYLLLVPTRDDLEAEMVTVASVAKEAPDLGAGVDDVRIHDMLVAAMARKADREALSRFALLVWRRSRASAR